MGSVFGTGTLVRRGRWRPQSASGRNAQPAVTVGGALGGWSSSVAGEATVCRGLQDWYGLVCGYYLPVGGLGLMAPISWPGSQCSLPGRALSKLSSDLIACWTRACRASAAA